MLTISRIVLSFFFIVAGCGHFLLPKSYLAIMPPYLPFPLVLIALSGCAEIAGGIAILIPLLRPLAGWGLISLLVAVFPANIYAFQNGMSLSGHLIPNWILLLRLPIQALFIYWVYWSCCRSQKTV